MADPRKFTGTQFKCAKSKAMEDQANANKKNALQGLSNIAGIETGTGITSKLNDFVRLSNSGGPELNKVLNDGVNGTLGILGMNPETVNTTLQKLNPGVVNTGIGAIKSMHKRMETGSLSFSNLPSYARDLNQLKKFYNNATISQSVEERKEVSCYASPYAMDLVNYGIKHKFMFVVEFIFNDPYSVGTADNNSNVVATLVKQSSRPNINYEHEEVNMYNFRTKVIKNAIFEPIEMILIDDSKNHSMEFLMNYIRETIPVTNGYTPSFAFEESGMDFSKDPVFSDQYEQQKSARQQNKDTYQNSLQKTNTQYATGIQEIEDKYQQDLKKAVQYHLKGDIDSVGLQDLFKDLKKQRDQKISGANNFLDIRTQEAAELYELDKQKLGEISDNIPKTQTGSASIGTLNNNKKTILKEIRIFHVFDQGNQMNVYHIHNPKILQVTMDELNMEDSSGNYLTLNIGYDAFDVATGLPLHGVPDNSLPSSGANLGVNYFLHDSTYTGPNAYRTGTGVEFEQPTAEEHYETPPEPQFKSKAPNGEQIYSNDGNTWFDKNEEIVVPGTQYTVDGVTSTFNPPAVNGFDPHGFPLVDGDYADFDTMFTLD